MDSRSPIEIAFLHGLDEVTEITLVRHGQQRHPDDPTTAPASAYLDPPLSETGRRQARTVGEALAATAIDAVFASPLQRALDTGRAIAGHHGLEPIVHEGLTEISLFANVPAGKTVRESLTEEELAAVGPRFVAERRWDAYPFAEARDGFHQRVLDALDEIVGRHAGQHVVVACHGGVINAVLRTVLGMDEDMFFRPGHASISRLAVHEERRVVRSMGETHHLLAVDPALVTH